jgi:hypothetical protein
MERRARRVTFSLFPCSLSMAIDDRRTNRTGRGPAAPSATSLRAPRCQHGAVTYFADLSPYSYGLDGRHDHLVEQPDAVNVGWLGTGHEFPAGQAPGWLVPGILKLVAGARVNQTRGYHVCDLCQCSRLPPIEMELDGRKEALGDAEIRARGADGTLYAAPSLIAHYVAEHGYRPPDGFIEAIRETAQAGQQGEIPPADRG